MCGNLPHIETLINSRELKIISHHENNIFINYYSKNTPKECIEKLGYHFEFANGRRLEFIRTPYAHSPGSFVTYDVKTKILFSSDIFGSYDNNWNLYTLIGDKCLDCTPRQICPITGKPCQIKGMVNFHQRIMPSKKALHYALERIEELDISMIAPQHGSILDIPEAQSIAIKRLKELTSLGIDYFLEGEGN